jgi:hypothetical protein
VNALIPRPGWPFLDVLKEEWVFATGLLDATLKSADDATADVPRVRQWSARSSGVRVPINGLLETLPVLRIAQGGLGLHLGGARSSGSSRVATTSDTRRFFLTAYARSGGCHHARASTDRTDRTPAIRCGRAGGIRPQANPSQEADLLGCAALALHQNLRRNFQAVVRRLVGSGRRDNRLGQLATRELARASTRRFVRSRVTVRPAAMAGGQSERRKGKSRDRLVKQLLVGPHNGCRPIHPPKPA